MMESDSSSSSLPKLTTNRETPSERTHGYWNKIFKFAKKKDKLRNGKQPEGDLERTQERPIENAPERYQFDDRKRSKSLQTNRSRMVMPPAPRSGRFFTFNSRRQRRRFLKKSNASDKDSTQLDDEKHDNQKLFTDSSLSPSSIVPFEEEVKILSSIHTKRASLAAIRNTKANLTMMFARDELLPSSQSPPFPEKTKIETRDDFCLNPRTSAGKKVSSELRTRSLLNIRIQPSSHEQRHASIIPASECDLSSKTEIDNDTNQGVAVVSVSSDQYSHDTTNDSLDNTTSGSSRLFSLRDMFRQTGSQNQRAKSSHISLSSSSDIRLQKPVKDEPSRLLMRRSSSLPQNVRISAGTSNSVSGLHSRKLASSDDGLQCPWGVKATKKKSESLVVRNAPLTFRIADISSALHFTAKRDKSLNSKSINLSDDDYEQKESVLREKQDSEIEMQHDDFIEYTVKKAKKQRK